MWKFRLYTSWEEIWSDVFQRRWKEMLETAANAHVFFHPLVARIWVETYLPLRRMDACFVWASDDRGNEAFLPLVIWHRNWKNAWMKTIVPVGFSDYDYHDPLFREKVSGGSLTLFWKELCGILQTLGVDEVRIDGIRDETKGDCWSAEASWMLGEICPCLHLSGMGGEPGLMAFFSTKLRGDIRRQIRRLNEVAPLTFKEYSRGSELPDRVFEDFMAVHRQKWPNAYKAPGFHRRLVDQCSKEGPIHFSTLMVGDTVVAWHLGFEFKGTYYYYMPAGHPDYQKLSPVKVHLYYLVCRAIERGCHHYDHLRGDETYKGGWANGSQYVNTLLAESGLLRQQVKKGIIRIKQLAMSIS